MRSSSLLQFTNAENAGVFHLDGRASRFRDVFFRSSNAADVRAFNDLLIKKCPGNKKRRSFGKDDIGQRGRLFRIASTFANNLRKLCKNYYMYI